MVDQNCFLADDFDLPPADDDVVVVAHQPHTLRPAVNDDRHQLRSMGIHLDIVHAAQTAAVADIDDLFVVHVRDPAKHIRQLLYRSRRRILRRSCLYTKYMRRFLLTELYIRYMSYYTDHITTNEEMGGIGWPSILGCIFGSAFFLVTSSACCIGFSAAGYGRSALYRQSCSAKKR